MINEFDLPSVLLTQLWQVTIVAGVVGGAAWMVSRRQPHLAHVLWLLVIVKCLTPPLLTSPSGLLAPLPADSSNWMDRFLEREVPSFVAAGEANNDSRPAYGTSAGPARTSSALTTSGWFTGGLLTIWGLGILVFAVAAIRRWLSCYRSLARGSVPASRSINAVVERLRQRLAMRRQVRVLISRAELGPLVYGVWRPTIVIPQSLLDRRSARELKPILAHEMIHVRRGDTLIAGLQFLARLIWWFHPLVWWANRQANWTCEQCCDEEVVAGLQCEPRLYARCLLRIAELKHRLRPVLALTGVRAAQITSQRMENLMKPSHKFQSRTPRYCWGVLFVTAMLFLPAGRGAGQGPGSNSDPASSTRLKADGAFQSHHWKDAATAYRQLVNRNPNDARSWFRLGYALHADRQLEEAIKAHRRAAKFNRLKPVALYNLACALCLQGKHEESLTALEQAVEAGFRSQQPVEDDADFAALVNDPKFLKLAEAARPPAERAAYRQFDFWIGHWDVFDKNGAKVGSNVITKDERGFLLTEKWTNLRGSTGTSINYFDPSAKQWKQTWIDASGNIVKYAGEFRAGKMDLTGETILVSGRKAHSRMTFTPLSDGRVRQVIHRSTDGGKTWSIYFDGHYVRKPNKSPAAG